MSEGRRFCENCGTGTGEATNFCPNCGASQGAPQKPVPGSTPGDPLLELHTHWFMTGRPVRITVYESGVEYARRDPFRTESQRMSYEQIAQVAVKRGLVFSTLVIESRGGGSIVAENLPKNEVDKAARLIEERMSG